tara:strand:- start:123379 stop:125043 length:1665 start_codon:yes stop_codon:yes gene_type:complete
MLFQSPEFLVLFLVVLGWLMWVRHVRAQHLFLVAISYLFYGWWDVRFVLLIVLSTMIDYTAALGIDGYKISPKKRLKMALIMAGSTLALLLPNWPMLQTGDWQGWLESPLVSFSGENIAAMSLALGFSIIGPIVYGAYFGLSENKRKKAFLITSVVANLGMLAFFKYFNFFIDSLDTVVAQSGIQWAAPVLKVTLPVGISFYTFQTMSYTIDAYRGDIKPERSLLRVALFVAYFPQLVAGPILRPQQLLPTLDRPWTVTGASMRAGMNLALVGLFKKVLIADNVAPMVDTIFSAPQGQSSLIVMLGTALFAVQIYCDFSGYTDIARGISRVFGVEIPLNFNFPYFSTSIIEFWRRWHISLSSWLRDYLYIPLGGSRKGPGFTYINLMLTMLLGGLWHGASWNFVIWGGYQGVLLCLNRLLQTITPKGTMVHGLLISKPGTVVRWVVTTYFWMLGWLIFRVTNFEDLVYCAKKFVLFDGRLSVGGLGLGRGSPVTAMIAVMLFVGLHIIGFVSKRWDDRLNSTPWILRALMYAAMGMLFFYGWPSQSSAFIYFQF